ncbi:endonuclease/exonuclease/phosphatase family protein [Pontibacter sp. JH31]|uniref:Endonuclease/exonuclease/phosphatase family protein n=1 Tax=Pontibacter aquaedesilientis TaxID=2766980 RepID=A0ABR7XKY9_9BACT|nr:endonuclease/exonuclease/phosphatase family protein [Pontibacter aquaedesilientis]MBD1398943.1 endonuclease/exonuclease/phosphatase family protein [Pontibacter aquaedesilientis]
MKDAAKITLQALGTFAVLATALPLLDAQQWYVRVFDYPRMQLLVLALLVFVLYLWRGTRHRKRDKLLLGTLAAAIVYQSIMIFPYTRPAPNQVEYADANAPQDALLSILVANVLMDNESYDKLINLTQERDPDILLLLESDSVWQEAVKPTTRAYPHRVEVPLSNTYGMHLYSKLPLRQQKVSYLLDDDIPSIKTYVQLRSGLWVELHAVHPKPPVPTEDPNSKKRDAEIVMIAKDIADSQYPVVVAGDFNDVAWSRTTKLFQKTSGLLDPRIGRGFYNTFNAKYPVLRWPLDHIFHSDHFKLVSIDRLPDIDSDHFPIYIQLSFAPENKYEQEGPKADEATKKEAAETITEGKEEAVKEK